MKQATYFTFLLLVILSLSACHNYKPTYLNSPSFEQRNDLFIDFNVGSQLGGNLSYSPLKNWGVVFNAGTSFKTNVGSDSSYYVNQDNAFVSSFSYQNYTYEVASGIYGNLSENVFYDLYLGYGKGESGASQFNFDIFNFDQNLVAYNNSFENVFLQGDLKFQVVEDLKLMFSGRVNRLNFQDLEFIYEEPTAAFGQNGALPPQSEIDRFFYNNQRTAYQLVIGIEGDAEYFIVNAQVQFGITDNDYSEEPNYFSVRPFSFFLGVSLPLRELFKTD